MKKLTTFDLTLCAFFAALTAVCSQITIPIQPVPINLAMFSVFCFGPLLGAKKGAVSQTVYIIMGAAGLPVFSNFRGGAAVLLGPTGGYIIGYIAAALLAGLITDLLGRKKRTLIFAMLAAITVCYLMGTCWYVLTTDSSFKAAFAVCVLPFLVGDVLKIVCAVYLSFYLYPVLRKRIYNKK